MKNVQNSSNYKNNVIAPVSATTVQTFQFRQYLTFLKIIKPHFENFFTRSGVFRATNLDRSCIIETEFKYFRNIDFSIANIKVLVNMLSTLAKKTEISVTIDDKHFVFSDGSQSVHVPEAHLESIENNFISDEKMSEILFENIDVDKPFIKEKKPKIVVCNIYKLTPNIYGHEILVKHKKDDLNKGYLVVYMKRNSDKCMTPAYTVKFEKNFLFPMMKDHYFHVTKFPFIFNKADMTFNYFINKNGRGVTAIYNTTVDGLFINIYARSSLIKDYE